MIVLVFAGIFGTVYAVPEPDPEHSFRYSEIVIEGRILSVSIISEPIIYRTEDTYYEQSGIAVYDVQVVKSLKNPGNVKTITVAGYFLREPHPMAYETYPYEVGQKVLLYLQENTHGDGNTDLIIRSSTSKIVAEPDSDLESLPPCKSGPSPGRNFVFFDCNWVEVPDHWKFENGKWQEDPSVLKLGPEPDPVCPEVAVCTCPGKYNYYNSTDNRCYSSPYIPTSYQNACKQYAQLDFAGWAFNENTCDWVSASNPYTDDERLRLASEKVEPGGLGIDPVFDASTIIVGVLIGASVVVGITYYWRKRR